MGEVVDLTRNRLDAGRWGVCMLGAPGCGKGTQGALLAEALGGQHVSVGDLVRHELSEGRRLPFDRKLGLANTRSTAALVQQAVAVGFGPVVLDGFPRHAVQVGALEQLGFTVRGVIWLEACFETVIARMRAREREGENTPKIGMRQFQYSTTLPQLRLALQLAGIPGIGVSSEGTVERVHVQCVHAIHSLCA